MTTTTRTKHHPIAAWVVSCYCCSCGALLSEDDRAIRLCPECAETAREQGRHMAREMWAEVVVPAIAEAP